MSKHKTYSARRKRRVAIRLSYRRPTLLRRLVSNETSFLERLRAFAPVMLVLFASLCCGGNLLHFLSPCECCDCAFAHHEEFAASYIRCDGSSVSQEDDDCQHSDASFACPICRFFSQCRALALFLFCLALRFRARKLSLSSAILILGRLTFHFSGRAPPRRAVAL